MHVVILAAREGWHTRELTRALEARGHTGTIVPYEGLVAVDRAAAPASGAARPSSTARTPCSPASFPSGSLEQIIYPRGRAAPPGGARRPRDELARAPSSARWTSSGPRRCSSSAGCPRPTRSSARRRRRRRRVPRARRRDREAAVRLHGPRHGPRERRGDGLPGVQDHRADPRRVLPAAGHRPRRPRRPGLRASAGGCWRRSSARSEGWRTNLAAGRRRRGRSSCPDAWAGLALRAAAAVGAEYAGVDLLPARDGTVYVLEVNGIPGWEGLQQATGVDVAGALVDHLAGPAAVTDPGGGGRGGAARLPARGQRAEAGQRLARAPLSRHALRGLPGQRRGHRSRRSPPRATTRSGATIRVGRRGHRPLDAVATPTSGIILLLAPLARAALRSGGAAARRRAARCWRRRRSPTRPRSTPPSAARGPAGWAAGERRTWPPRRPSRCREAMAPRRRARQRRAGVRHRLRGHVRDRRAGAPARRGAPGSTGPTPPWRPTSRLLAAVPDTHIARKLGRGRGGGACPGGRARSPQAGGVRTEDGRRALAAFDAELREPDQHAAIPGTTADLTCAALFVVILEDGWNR